MKPPFLEYPKSDRRILIYLQCPRCLCGMGQASIPESLCEHYQNNLCDQCRRMEAHIPLLVEAIIVRIDKLLTERGVY